MKIHRGNLLTALDLFILLQRKREKEEFGYTKDSALVAGMVELLTHLEDGGEIEFYPEQP